MFNRLGIRAKLLLHGLLTVALALVLVIGVMSVSLWRLSWSQARERLNQATRVVANSLTTRIAEANSAASRIVADKDLAGKTSFVQESSGKADLKEMLVTERRNLTQGLGRAMTSARATEASLYDMEGKLICAAAETPDKHLELWCPDDSNPGHFARVVIVSGQMAQTGDWHEASPPSSPATSLATHPGTTSTSACAVRSNSWWIFVTAPVMGEALNTTTFKMENVQRGQLRLGLPFGAEFIRAQRELTGMSINLYAGKELAAGDAKDLVAPTHSTSDSQVKDGLVPEALSLTTAKVAGGSFFTALVPVRAGGVDAGTVALMLSQDEAQKSLISVNLQAIGAGLIAALVAMVMGLWLTRSIASPIRCIADVLASNAEQTHGAASQVSSSSQSLATGASNQAAAVEQTSSSLEEMASMTHRNAESAAQANQFAREARLAVDAGAKDMQAMASAMDAIKASSNDIAKIIKTIDEIAFQTNILALNAAVEAARAGEAGLGFAVVAEEVRALAKRSAEAARETASKIDGAITNAAQGVAINAKVAATLQNILGKTRQVDELVSQVATASKEQGQGIEQINQAITQIDNVTQSTAAGSEECASAAAELTGHALILKKAVAELTKLLDGSSGQGT